MNTLAMITLIIVGALVFVGLPLYAKLQWPGWFALFVATAALWLWALFAVRRNFGREVERRLATSSAALRAGLDILADIMLAGVVVVSITLLEDLIFDYDITLGGWRIAILYYTAIIFFFRTLRHLRTSMRRHVPQQVGLPDADLQHMDSLTDSSSVPIPVNTGPLYYVQAEDHYVKMVFSDNVQHLRARFRDVVAGLGDAGLKVQKSFWVNRDAVTDMRRVGRRLHLVLKDGAEIPVSRTCERQVQQFFPTASSPATSPTTPSSPTPTSPTPSSHDGKDGSSGRH